MSLSVPALTIRHRRCLVADQNPTTPACAKGHPLTAENTRTYRSGGAEYRRCRICYNASRNESRWRHVIHPAQWKATARLHGASMHRFLKRVEYRPDGCWVWTGGKNEDGYGRMRIGGQFFFVHQLSLDASGVDIPAGMVPDHLCRCRPCVNPAHLRVVTRRENTLAEGSLSIAKINADKTHCKHGHPFDAANTYRSRDGMRHCRRCSLEASLRCRRPTVRLLNGEQQP